MGDIDSQVGFPRTFGGDVPGLFGICWIASYVDVSSFRGCIIRNVYRKINFFTTYIGCKPQKDDDGAIN